MHYIWLYDYETFCWIVRMNQVAVRVNDTKHVKAYILVVAQHPGEMAWYRRVPISCLDSLFSVREIGSGYTARRKIYFIHTTADRQSAVVWII